MEPPEASSEPPRAPLFSTEADQPSREDSSASGDGGDELFSKAQRLMERITASRDNPSPAALHALASMLESEESRYMEETGYSSLNNERASHGIGQLGNLIRENDEFFDLISTKFLSEIRYSITVQAAAARLLLSCSLTWTYPHIFEETVLDNIKKWVMDDTVCPGGYCKLKHDSEDEKSSDSELLWTYSTGLLVVCLYGGDITVEDALTSGLSAKLMHHLRSCVLGEKSTSHKGSSYMGEKLSSVSSFRGKGENRTRVRQVSETTHMQDGKLPAGESVPDQIFERDHGKSIDSHARGEECWLAGGQQFDGLCTGVHADDVDADGESLWRGGDLHVGKTKFGECDENVRDDSRSRVSRGWARTKGKGWINEEFGGNEQALNFPGPGGQLLHGRITKDRSLLKNSDGRKVLDVKKSLGGREADGSAVDGDHIDNLLEEFIVGSKDISKVIKKAVLAAEAEARVVSAPSEAIKAAGDAAAELVKGAAVEEFQATSDEDAAFLAASKAALTVIDAATAVEMARSSNSIIAMNSKAVEPKIGEENEDYILPARKSLVHMKEKYCIQCLEILGEYVEVLGPILHEKGVDVCLALLQQTSKPQNGSEVVMLLPDVLKLICVLAAHRKFAALFVDRGGVQKLIAVPRVAQTFFGLSSCLYTIGSLQGIMEHVCALPSDVVHHFVGLALQLLECPQDQARKNAALFFATSFVFRAVIDSFDVQDGLLKVLSLLHAAASVRSGVNSGAVGLSTLGSLRDRSPSEILTSSEKQIAYHNCVALRQYFRAHLLLLVDSIRPSKSSRSACRNIPSVRAAYKPFDISNEAIDAVLLQLQKDRKLGPVFVRAHWPAVDKFLASNGHITMLELCQAPPVERYLGDLLQYALGVLHIVTLVPYSRKLIVNCILSNNRVGIAVILDAANSAGCIEPDIIQPALNVLVNLVCPPPSISNKPPPLPQTQQSVTVQTSNLPIVESRERNAERNIPDRVLGSGQSEPRERSGESSLSDRGCTIVHGQLPIISGSQTHVPAVPSRLVGDRRISLGIGAGSAGLAAQLEQGYHHAREAVRANNGIKVLLHLLQPRIASPPATLDCLRALACRVLLGLARDDTIAQILTKLQVGKRLSELIHDSDNQIAGTEQGRWQAELMQVAIELIAIVTNLGRTTTLAATDAATPTLRRIERAAIAAATPIAYHARELLLLIHEHLQASGLAKTAVTLLKEAQLTPLPSLTGPSALAQHASVQENPPLQLRWPCGRCPGFLSNKLKVTSQDEDSSLIKCDSAVSSLMKNPLVFSSSHSFQSRNQPQFQEVLSPTISGVLSSSNKPSTLARCPEVPISSLSRPNLDVESQCKTPILLPLKRKLTESKDVCLGSSAKRLDTGEFGLQSSGCRIPNTIRKSSIAADSIGFSTPRSTPREQCGQSMHVSVPTDSLIGNQCGITRANQFGFQNDPHPSNIDRLTLDSLVVQYLKHQHRQCTAPITTLPPLSLLHPHNCPEPRRSLDAPSNVTARIFMSEFKGKHGGMQGNQRDRQLVYSRFRPWRTCRHEAALLTCLTFLGNSSHIAAGSHSGELKVFDSDSNNVVESCTSHQSPLTRVQSCLVGEAQLLLSSSSHDVRLWDASSVSAGPMHSFQGCKSASFSNSGTIFAALPSEQLRREVLLYDTQTFHLESTLSDTSSTLSGLGRGHAYSLVHFSPLDTMLLWNGVLWDPRSPGSVHRFDQFTDYGGGGFHPAGNEVIINSEVWDLRKFRLLRSVPSLDQTVITFNPHGDVIYAILRRNLEDITSAVNTRRFKHPLFAAFRTIDAVNYSDIATTPVDRCVLDFATEPTDSFVGLVTMDDQEDMFSSARVYEIGRRRPTDDDSDPDDVESEEEEEEDVGDSLLGSDFDDGDSDDGEDDTSNDEDSMTDDDMDDGGAILEIVDESDDDDDSELMGSVSSEDEDDLAETF